MITLLILLRLFCFGVIVWLCVNVVRAIGIRTEYFGGFWGLSDSLSKKNIPQKNKQNKQNKTQVKPGKRVK